MSRPSSSWKKAIMSCVQTPVSKNRQKSRRLLTSEVLERRDLLATYLLTIGGETVSFNGFDETDPISVDDTDILTDSNGKYVPLSLKNVDGIAEIYGVDFYVNPSGFFSFGGPYLYSFNGGGGGDGSLDPGETLNTKLYLNTSGTFTDIISIVGISLDAYTFVTYTAPPNGPTDAKDATSPEDEDPCNCDCSCSGEGIPSEASWPSQNAAKYRNVTANVSLSGYRPSGSMIAIDWQISGGTAQRVYYSTDNLPSEGPISVPFTHQFDVSSLSTGAYSYTATISSSDFDSALNNYVFTGELAVVQPDESLGNGGIEGVGKLHSTSSGKILDFGDGMETHYVSNGDGTYSADDDPFSLLEWDSGSSTYTLTNQEGQSFTFNSVGLVQSKKEKNGEEVTYSYTDADGDLVADELASINKPGGKTVSYSYSSGMLSSVTDEAGRVTSYTYDSNDRIETITTPDPDGAGGLAATVKTYTYHASGRVSTISESNGQTTQYIRNASGELLEKVRPDGSSVQYDNYAYRSLPESGYGTLLNPAPLSVADSTWGTITNSSGVTTYYAVDSHGNVTRSKDELGNITLYERNAAGLVTKITQPDPDGAGPLESPIFEYTYDNRGNMLTETLPDKSMREWDYHSTWNEPIKYTDANGHITLYTYDSSEALLLSETNVIGLIDDGINLETDDLTISFTYTPAPSLSTDPPKGLLASVTEADGVVTEFEYDKYGNRTKTTYAVGTSDEAFTSATFDLAGNMLTETDELGNTTTYTYDNFDRVTSITSADPDGTGSLSATVISYTYNAFDLVATESINGRTTSYAYDKYGRLETVTEEDPDDSGPLLAPETSYTYDSDGNVLTITDPLGNVTSYGYTNGLLTSITEPDPDGASSQTAPVTSMNYDDAGRLLSVTDPLGRVTSFAYDNLGRQISTTLPDPDGAGSLPALSSTTVYDALGLIVSKTDFDGMTTSFTYDSEGNVLTETTAFGTTTYTYDELNRLVLADGPGYLETAFVYSAVGQIVSMTMPKGTTTYTYDNRRRLTSVTQPDPDGAGPATAPTTSTTYDDAGNVLTETDANGNVTTHTYDALNRITATTQPDPDGAGPQVSPVTNFAYDQFGQLVSVTDPSGATTSYEYDDLGRQTKVVYADPDGAGPLASPEVSYAYDAARQLTSMTDPLGNTTTYEYDNLGRLTSETRPDPDGAGSQIAPVITTVYNSAGEVISVTDPLGQSVTYTYDGMGRILTETYPIDPDGSGPLTEDVRTYAYTEEGWLLSVTESDPDGLGSEEAPFTSYDYNTRGEVVAETTLDGTTEYLYDTLGRLVQFTRPDPDGPGGVQANQTTYFYDAVGDRTQVYDGYRATWQNVNPLDIDGDGITGTQADYNAFMQVYGQDAPGPYDPNHPGVYGDIDGDGEVDLADFADFVAIYGQDLDYPDARTIAGHLTLSEYDNLGRLVKTTDAEGGETVYTYDANGNRLTLTDPVGNTTTWTYDALNRMLTNTNELSDTRSYEYDAVGNVIEYTDRNGRVTAYEYDNLHRRTAEKWMDGVTILRTLSYTYDAASQLTSASDAAATYTFTYDNLGRNTSTEHDLAALGFDVVIDEEYDALGRRTGLAAEIDGTKDLINTYAYDYWNRTTQVTQAGQSGGNAVAEKRVDFTYDSEDKGLFTSITRYADLAGTELVAKSTYSYDAADNLTSLTHQDSGSNTLAGYTYTYDSAYRLTTFSVYGHSDEDVTYTHDATNQLTGADRSGTSADESYTYDENGNRTNAGYSTGDNNQLLSDGMYNYTYDDEGNRLTKTNISTGEVIEYEWDYRNRLVGITTKTSGGTVNHEVQYTYDVFNRRIVKTIDADGAGAGTAAEEVYIYDGLREERGNAGDYMLLRFDEADELTDRFMYGPNVDQILASEEVTTTTSAGDALWALTDHLGTVRDVLGYDAGTDTSTVQNHLVYDSFGNIVSETNSAVDFLFAFTGRERDEESDLQYYRFRYYDAAIGRWIGEDPVGFDAADPNLQRYVANAPLSKIDPSGLYGFPYYIFPWEDFPSYDPTGGITNPTGGFNSGNPTFFDWIENDPERARDFLEGFQNQWGDLVSEISNEHGIPEALMWISIYSEMVNFGWNDYMDLGDSLGPGQLSTATKKMYGCPERWEDKPNGIPMSRGHIFILRMNSLEDLGKINLPDYKQPAERSILMRELYMLGWVLRMQMLEINMAATGGGKLEIPGKGPITIPAMNPNFIVDSGVYGEDPFNTPGVGSDFTKNLDRLAVILIKMNRINPIATGSSDPHVCEGTFTPAGPQTTFAWKMLKMGYFEIKNGKLIININDKK